MIPRQTFWHAQWDTLEFDLVLPLRRKKRQPKLKGLPERKILTSVKGPIFAKEIEFPTSGNNQSSG